MDIYSSLEKMNVIRVVQHTNLKFLEENKYWSGRTVMSPFKQLHNTTIPSPNQFLGWMDTFVILIRDIMNDVHTL